MNRFLNVSILLALLLTLASCSSPFSYFGKTYPATENPEMFFRESDVGKEFEVMGKLEAEMPAEKNTESFRRRLCAKLPNTEPTQSS